MREISAIHRLVAEAEGKLKSLVEQEQQDKTTRPTMYMFVYEQQYNDAPGWGPNYQCVQACSVGEAFRMFGYFIDKMSLVVRNVCYGLYSEMEPEEERIRQYWREERVRQKGRISETN